MKETNDVKMLMIHANGVLTNLLIVIQILIYWANTNEQLKGLKENLNEKPKQESKKPSSGKRKID